MIIQGNARNEKGQFVKGVRAYPETEFKKGSCRWPEKPYWHKNWLENEYLQKERSAADIANEFGVTECAILQWLRKHNIQPRTMSEIRSKKHWGSSGKDNGMYGSTGNKNPNWKNGCTPDRQSFYVSEEWKKVCRLVYARDNARCVKCGSKENLHVHHIVSFSVKEKRADVDNLVLLCEKCHRFVHSKKNTEKEFIQ